MRLSELEPHWVATFDAPEGVHQGVRFNCPCCGTQRLVIMFDVSIGDHPPADLDRLREVQADCDHPEFHRELQDHHMGAILWHRVGETFENLTLTPSIDASKWGHWHGFITNGAIT